VVTGRVTRRHRCRAELTRPPLLLALFLVLEFPQISLFPGPPRDFRERQGDPEQEADEGPAQVHEEDLQGESLQGKDQVVPVQAPPPAAEEGAEDGAAAAAGVTRNSEERWARECTRVCVRVNGERALEKKKKKKNVKIYFLNDMFSPLFVLFFLQLCVCVSSATKKRKRTSKGSSQKRPRRAGGGCKDRCHP